MKNLHVAVLATLFGISAASGIALTQAQHPGNNSGLLAATASVASADENERGSGRGQRGNRNNNGNWQNGQCNNGNWQQNGQRRNNGDGDDNNNGEGQNNQGNGNRGKHRGWQNPNNPHYCGNNGNGNCTNGQYNGQYGQQNGQYNCYPNGGGGQQGNSVLRGTITSVNGNQVTLMAGFGNIVTINDQPALNNQQTGRIVVGRYVTAYGYYQNGIFYATSLQ